MDKSTTFPGDKSQVLAMLYLQEQNLSDRTPEEIAELYQEAEDAIRNYFKEQAASESGGKKQSVTF
jgi:hypothetical protein